MAKEIFIVFGLSLLLFLFIIAIFAFWIWMIIDCARRDFKKSDDKIIWLLVVILVGIIGAILYYFIIKQKNKR